MKSCSNSSSIVQLVKEKKTSYKTIVNCKGVKYRLKHNSYFKEYLE